MAGEDAVSYIFGGNTGLTYEQLKRRRAVALALASQRRGYPKTVGEGLTYLGESMGDLISERRLDAAEKEAAARASALAPSLMPGAGAAPIAAPARPGAEPTPIIPPAAPRPPSAPVRLPAAPIPPRPAPAAPPASAAGPAPSITATPILPSGPSSEDMTSGPPPSEFAMGGILNAAPMSAPNLEPAFPGETGGTGQAGLVPSSGYLPPAATAAAPPSTPPAPQATAPPAPVSAMDYASWPHGPIRRPTDTAVEESTAGPTAPPAAPAAPAAALGPQSSIQLTPQQRDVLARTIYGEASNQADVGQQAVANVILNRARLAGTAPDYEALKRNQFEPWWNQRARARMERLSTEDPAYQRAQAAIDAALAGDPTGGATHFYSPSVQAALGRRDPGWARGEPQMIGTHAFYRLPYGGQQPAPTEDGGGNIRLAAYAPDGGAGAPIPGMGGAGSPRLQPQIPPLQGPPPAPESEQITPTDIMPMPATAQFGPPVGRFSRTDAPVPGVAAAPPPQAPAVAPPPPQGPPPAAPTIPGVDPEYTKQLQEPPPPTYPDKLSPDEEKGWKITLAHPDPNDPLHQAGQRLADFGKAQREAGYKRDVEAWTKKIELIRTENAKRYEYFRNQPKVTSELEAKQREAALAGRFGSVKTYETLVSDLGKSYDKASSAANVLPNLYDAKEMAKNAITGFGANARLDYNRALNSFGLTATGDKVRDTQALQAAIAPLVGAILKSTTGTTQVSEGDRKFAQAAAGGDITLDAPAIQRILDIGERSFKANITEHNKHLGSVFTDPQGQDRALHARYKVDMPLSSTDKAAQEWLAQNPNDPRAEAVRRKLGVQ